MKLVSIFEDSDYLLSTKGDYEKQHEFSKLFDQWTDIEYLNSFFTQHQRDLSRPFWEGISIEQAIIETRKEAINFRTYLRNIASKPPKVRMKIFARLFQPLHKNQITEKFLDEKKSYGRRNKTWLRIYALKAGDDLYIFTGGAIKLTDNMNEREHTRMELKKLDNCKQFLLNEGYVDEDGIFEFLELQ